MAEAPPALGGDWRITALVAVVVTLPLLVVLQLGGDAQSLSETAVHSGLIAYLTLLAAAISVYFTWRVTHDDATGWMAAAMCLAAVQGASLQLRSLVDPSGVKEGAGWQIVVHTPLIVVVVLFALAAGRRVVLLDPMALGVLGGAGFVLVRWCLTQNAPDLDLPEGVTIGFRVLVGLCFLGLIAAVMLVPTLPSWVRLRMTGVVALMGVAYQATFPLPEGSVISVVAVVAHVLAGVLVGATSFAMLRAVLHDERSHRWMMRSQVDRLESLARLDRARLHEVGATIAGIQKASHLLDSQADLPPSARSNLTTMMREETARLLRLLASRTPAVPSVVAVDRALAPVVDRQTALGQRVTWAPTGLLVWARTDELAEVVSILLDNASRHAPGVDVVIRARDTGARIEITVADSGPGVAADAVERLFHWGYSGPGSQGQGIGLAIARQLLEDVGGSLRYEDARPGARFVLGLRRVTPGAGAAEE